MRGLRIIRPAAISYDPDVAKCPGFLVPLKMQIHQSILRFLLEVAAVIALWNGAGVTYALAAIALWGAFGVENDPTRGRPWILVNGKIRLAVELVVFAGGTCGFVLWGRTEYAAVYVLLLLVHHYAIRKRLVWIWGQK